MSKQQIDITQLRNVRVKTLRAHNNRYGDKFAKPQGYEYVHPRPAGDIKAGIVELVEEKAGTAKATDTKAK